MKDRIWPFVVGNNLFPIVLIALAGIAYLHFARSTERAPPIQETPSPAPIPKYVEKIIEKHHYLPSPDGKYQIQFLPKQELEKQRPGSVSPEVIRDKNQEIVARTEIEPTKYRTQVDAVRRVDPDRGIVDFRLDTRRLPRKFFDLKQEWHGGIYYGVTGDNILEAEARVNPLRLGAIETVVKGRVGVERNGGDLNGAVLVGIEY